MSLLIGLTRSVRRKARTERHSVSVTEITKETGNVFRGETTNN